MFSVWQRPQIVWGGGDEAGGGGEGSKGRSKNEMKTQTKINAELDKKKPDQSRVSELVAQRERDRAATARNTAGTKYTGLKDRFDGGGPGASGPQFRGGPFSGVTNPFGGGGGGGSSPSREAIPGPGTIAQRIKGSVAGTDSFHRPASNFKTINNSQRQALEAAGYSVTKQGTVKSRDGSATVAGSRWSRSNVVNQIMAENANDRASVRSGGGGKPAPVVPKKIVRPQLRPADLPKPTTAPLDYDTLYTGDPGMFMSPYQVGPRPSTYSPSTFPGGGDPMYAPRTAPSAPSSFNLDRALSTPFNIDDNIYSSVPEFNEAARFYSNAGLPADRRISILDSTPLAAAAPIADPSVLGPDYPPSTFAAATAGAGFNDPSYTTSFDDQAATESFGDRQRRRELAGGPTVFDGADARSYASAGLGDTGFGQLLNEYVLGDNAQLETTSSPVVPSAPYAPEMPVPPMPVQKRPEGVLPFMEGVGRVASEAEKANPNIDLRPGNPDRLMYGLAGKLGAENTAKLMAVAAQDMARLNEAMPLGSEITGYGEGSIDPRLADAANIQRNVPTMVGEPNVVAQLAQKAEDSIAAIIEDTTAGLNDRTKEALTSKIMEDGFKGAIFDGKFNTDAFMAQSAQVLGGIAPMVAAGTLNPYLGMAVAGAATAGDVSGLVEQKIRARADAGDFGAINPRQLEAVIQQAKMQTTLPSAALGAAGMGIFGKTKIGGMVGEIVAETVAEPTVAQLSSTINTDPLLRVDPKTGKMPGEGNLYDIADADTALLSLVGSAPLAAFTPTQMTVEDVGTGPVTPSVAESLGKAFGKSSIPRAAGLTRRVLGGPPTAAAAGDVISGTGVAPAAPAVQTVAPVQTLPGNLSGLGQQGGIPSLLANSGLTPGPSMVSPTALSVGNQVQGTLPNVQGFVPDGTAALQAETVKKTGEKKAAPNIIDTVGGTVDAPTPLTPEQIANVSPEAAVELDAALGVEPITAKPENRALQILQKARVQQNKGNNQLISKADAKYLEAAGLLGPGASQISIAANASVADLLAQGPEAVKAKLSEPTTAAEELISETAPTVNLADVAANKGTALQGAAAEVDNTLGTTDNMRHDEMIGSSGGLTGSQIYGDVVRALQGKDTVTRVEIMEMTPTMSDGVAGKVLDQLKDMGEVIGGKDANGVFRVNQNAVAKEIGVPYENPNKIVMRTPKSAGAAAGSSGVTDAILRKNPEYLPFGYDFNLRGDLETTLQDIAFEQGEANRAAGNPELGATDADAGVVPKTKEDLSRFLIEDLGKFRPYGSTVPTAMDTPQRQLKRQQDNIERARAQRAKTQAEAEAVANMEAFDTSLPVDPAGIGSLRNFPSNIPLVDSPAAQADRRRAIANRLKGEAEAEAMAPLNRAQDALDAVVDPVPAAIQSVEAQRAEMLAANKTYQDYINTRAQISALDGVTKEQAEREAFAAVEQRIEDQQQQLLNAVNAEGGTAAITNAANNEIAKLEAQLNAVKEVILNERTPFPVNYPPAPYKTTGETLMEKAAITTPVETPAMAPLVPAASPESVGEADITPPTLAEFIEAQRAEARDGVPVNPLAPPVEMPPSPQEQLALDLQGGSTVATPEGIMSLVDRTSKAPAAMDAVNPVVSPEISFEEAMDTVAEAPTVRAPKDAGPLVLTDPVTQSGIASAIPGRIPKDKLPTRFQSDLPVVDPFSRENQLARQAANRARFAEQENELAAAQGLTPASIAQASREQDAAAENRIEKERQAANAAALKGLATLRSPLRVTGIPDDDTVYEDVEEQTLPDELLTEPFNNTPPEDTGGEGTGTSGESAPKYVPVDMNNANNDDLGCPSGYARVFDPSTGQPICGRIDEPSAAGPAAPAEEAEEDGVVIDIPVTERPKISPYYVPEMIESNYTPYVPGRRASTQ